MKKILLFIFSFIYFSSFAQLDREHWFAPMMDRVSGNGTTQYQSIYMSTNEVVPFKVEIYHNNSLVATEIISKNNPVRHRITQRNRIITTNQNDLFRPVAMGYYLKGEKPFFASLRFSITNHGEIQTSKGTSGLGKEFRVVMAPITVNNSILNFMNSVMATEDNTKVTITDFSSKVVFSDNISRSQITFTLNKGQSYIIDGRGNNTLNYTGYIGAKIVSDKPVVIANGNFNGQYAGNFGSASDILMDQGVPVDKLGKTFVLVKGNGANSFDNGSKTMEKAIIVAVKDNTKIYLNANPTPVITLNTGQSYLTPPNSYVNQGFNHFNMSITSSEDIYVYQLLAGVESTSSTSNFNGEATGGFNYIPPLSCYLPFEIDEIGKIEENQYEENNGSSLTVPTKLNVITEKFATIEVKRNGVLLPITAANGPFIVSGNSDWVTYSFPNITGNISIKSSRAVTAGISAGNGAVGYGGYFAGFSFIPAIIKSEGDCLPGVKLEVTKGFLSYQWVEKVNGIYVPAAGVNDQYTYIPTQAGIYAVKIQQGSCPEIQTNDFKFYNCTTYTNYDYDICTEDNITPKFALSTQNVNVSTLTVDTPATKGTVTINKTDPTDLLTYGKVIYKAFPNAIGTDTFKYSFCGDGALPDCETVQATIHLNQIEKYDVVLKECSATSTANFNLTLAGISPDATVTKRFFKDAGYLVEIPVGQLTQYNSAPGFVYVKLSNAFGCLETATIELKIIVPPVVNPALYTIKHCDEDIDGVLDGTYKVVLTSITPLVVQNATSFTVKYYEDEAKAIAGIVNTDIKGTFSFTGNRSIWIRVDSPEVCAPVIKEILLQTGTKFAISTPIDKNVCDNNLDNNEDINLDNYTNLFTTNPSDDVKFYDDLTKAQNGKINENILAPQTITADKTFYYRFKKDGVCDALGTLNIILKKSTPTALKDSYTVCEGSSITLTAEPAPTYKAWSWIKGGVNFSPTNIATLSAGVYTVSFTNDSDCVFTKTITILESPKPIWNIAAYNATNCDNDFSGIIKVKFSTITPLIITNASLFKVEYSLFSNFSTLLPNDWTYTANTTVYVRASSEFCAAVTKTIDFKIGAQLTLIKKIAAKNVCDNNLDNTENINLDTYLTEFITNPYDSVKYFDDLVKAQNNLPGQNILALQTITADKTFYYRFKKDGVCDALGTLNLLFKKSTPTALKDSYTVCEGSSITLTAEPAPTYKAWSWIKAGVNFSPTNIATLSAGVYTVSFTNDSDCVFTKTITILESPKPIWNIAAYNATNCDNDFSGIIKVNFSTITPLIITNASLFKVEYSLFSNFSTLLPNDWTYTANTTVYVRASSEFCAAVTKTIDFKIGAQLTLIKKIAAKNVCDNNLDNTENINLDTYLTEFITNPYDSVKYFDDLVKAQNNLPGQNILALQTITADKTFYYRFKKDGVCDALGTLNLLFKKSTPTALKDSYTVCEGSSITLTAEPAPTYKAWSWIKAGVNFSPTNIATLSAGVYTVSFTNDSDCVFTKTITIKDSPKAVFTLDRYDATLCDDNFDGSIEVKFSRITPFIVQKFALYTIRYYTSQAFADAGGSNNLPDDWSFTSNTKIYVRVDSPACPYITGIIDFKFGNNLPLLTYDDTIIICDDNFDGIKTVNLLDYYKGFYNSSPFSLGFYPTLQDAQLNSNGLDANLPVDINNTRIFYLRIGKKDFCPSIAKLTLKIKIPTKSDILEDKQICPEKTTTLDAGAGFTDYLWSTGAKTESIKNVPVGDYWVDLTFDGCTYRQNVSVTAVELPKITNVDIQGTTVTVTVSGGKKPYQYSIDGINYQTSNIFTNVPPGDQTIYVISADQCAPVTAKVYIIRILNVITPNDDGMNDHLDYSDLLKKEEPFLQIFDRYGNIVFKGDQSNRFIWNGKTADKTVASSSYWYVLQWREIGATTVTKVTGWVLVKSRQ